MVRSRQRVEPDAVQPIDVLTPALGRKIEVEMKKVRFGILTIVVTTMLTGCIFFVKLSADETKDNNEISEKIIDGIFSKDVEKIKNLFSKQSSLEISDIDAQIKRLIDLVNETNIKEYKIENGFEEMSREYGKIEELSRVCFIWFPNYEESKYRINIDYYKINLKEPEMEGLVNIRFYKQIKYEDPELIIEIGNKRV